MAKKAYALLVGIDAYEEPVSSLHGCRNDVRHLEEYLRIRLGDSAEILTLVDAAATRAAVVDGFRTHLARAGAGDVAVFAYSGHGSQERPPDELAVSEASGRLQTLMLHDAGRVVDGELRWPLADKELRLLLETVAATGAHTVAILDCCHSGDATRDVAGATRQWLPTDAIGEDDASRAMIETLKGPREIGAFLDGAIGGTAAQGALAHVALYACQSKELAKEDVVGGEQRGVFSAALLEVLTTVGSTATYRDVLAAVRDRVERDFPSQRPDLFPEDLGGAGDSRFLDGTLQLAPPSLLMTRSGSGWTLDGGSMHGLSGPVDGKEFRLACSTTDGVLSGEVKVTSVQPATATVEPVDWQPDQPVYRAVIVKAPRPLATVAFVPVDDPAGAEAYRAVSERLGSSGPDGSPSLFVREAVGGAGPTGPALRVRYDPIGPSLRVERADGTAAVPPSVAAVPAEDASRAAAVVVGQLEHVARWERIRELGNHRSALADEVTINVFPGLGPSEDEIPPDRLPLAFTGEYVLEGEPGTTLYIWVRVAKRTARSDLFLALLDLDDQLSCQPLLETTGLLAEQWDQQFSFTAPAAGTTSRDWFKFIVSEFDFRAAAFSLLPVTAAAAAAEPVPDALGDAPAPSTRAASVVGPPPGPDSSAITLAFTLRATGIG